MYGIAHGKKVGGFGNKWRDTKCLTDGYLGARFKGFGTPNEAWVFVTNENNDIARPKSLLEVVYLTENLVFNCHSGTFSGIGPNLSDTVW